MKILQVHNKYKIRGGEWTVLEQEKNLLGQNHIIEQFIVDNTVELDTLMNKIKLIFSTHYNKTSRELMRKKLLDSKPDVMHVHNFFPLLSPSVFDSAIDSGVPSVLTLHNYRLLHPNGYLFHDGMIDEKSITGSAYETIGDAVYRNSVLQTAVVAHMIEYHRKKRTWQEKVDCFICLTEFAKEKFIEGGLPEEKIQVKPNFVDDILEGRKTEEVIRNKEDFYLFIGRISEEKGIRTLLKAWTKMKGTSAPKLMIIGHGPIEQELQSTFGSQPNIEWKGFMERSEVMNYLMKARALMFPSEWYEGMPMTILEAFSTCTPVIATNIGSQGEIVIPEENGLHFEAGNPDSLIAAVESSENKPDLQTHISRGARSEYEKKYTPEKNYSQLIELYSSLQRNK